MLGAKGILSESQRVDGWAGRRQVPRMTSSTEKHANLNTQVPLVVSHSWALASDLPLPLQGEQVIGCESMDVFSMCAAVTGCLRRQMLLYILHWETGSSHRGGQDPQVM